MGDEVDDLRAKVIEQGLALEGLQRAAADAEERHKLLEMMAQIGSEESSRYLAQLEQGEMLQRHRRNTPTLATGAGRVNAFPRKLATSVEEGNIGAGLSHKRLTPKTTRHVRRLLACGVTSPIFPSSTEVASFRGNAFTLPAPVANVGVFRRWRCSISPCSNCGR